MVLFPTPWWPSLPLSHQDILGPHVFLWLLIDLHADHPLGLASLLKDLFFFFLSPSRNRYYDHMFGFKPSD